MSQRAVTFRRPSTRRNLATESRSSVARPIAVRFGCRARTATAGSSSRPATRTLCQPASASARPDAPLMAKLVASTGAVIETDPAAHHYRFVGLEIAPTDGAYLRALMQIGAEEGPADALAASHHRRSLLSPRRTSTRHAPRRRAQFARVGRDQFIPVGLQGGRRRLAGHRRAGTAPGRSRLPTTTSKRRART